MTTTTIRQPTPEEILAGEKLMDEINDAIERGDPNWLQHVKRYYDSDNLEDENARNSL